MSNAKKILVLGSGLDAVLIAEALRTRGVEVYGLVTPERSDPTPTIPEMVHPSDVPFGKPKSESGPKPDPHAMPAKSVSMRARSR